MQAPFQGSMARYRMMPCRWLSLGIHVIAANKRLGAGPLADYQAVQEAQRKYRTHFLAEVGLFLMMDVMLNHEPTQLQQCQYVPLGIPTELHKSRVMYRTVISQKVPIALAGCKYTQIGSVPAQATVGAGLPVLSTLRSLLHTGDASRAHRGCPQRHAVVHLQPALPRATLLPHCGRGQGGWVHRARPPGGPFRCEILTCIRQGWVGLVEYMAR